MTLIIARWIFSIAAALGPGVNLPWPAMSATRLDGITEQITTEEVQDAAGNWVSSREIRHFCAPSSGVYQVTAHVGLMPLPAGAPDVHGQIWLRGPDGGVLLTRIFAAAGHWSVQGATHVLVAEGPSCYRLAYDLTGPAVVNPDTRATYLTVHKIGP
ncbi:MAG: hypothetical protein IPM64_17630 [Phycisphaerales bacterium]|nr:hypothetical protein [Phycisphaerales bacterium]